MHWWNNLVLSAKFCKCNFFAESKTALREDLPYIVSFQQKNLLWHFIGHKIFYNLSKLCTTDFHQIKYLHLETWIVFSIWKSFYLRNIERMSAEESVIFHTNLAHFRQHHTTLSHLSNKIPLKKVISIEVTDITLLPISSASSKIFWPCSNLFWPCSIFFEQAQIF